MPPAGLGLAEPALCSQPTIWPRGGEKLSDGSLITWWPTGLWGLGEVWAGEPTGPVQGRGTLQAASPSTSPPSLQCPTTIWVHRCPQRTPPPASSPFAHGCMATKGSLGPNCWGGRNGQSASLVETSWTHAGTSRGPSLALPPPHPQPQATPSSLEPSPTCVWQQLTMGSDTQAPKGQAWPAPEADPLAGVSCQASQRNQQPHTAP